MTNSGIIDIGTAVNGIFNGVVENSGTISAGTFTHEVTNESGAEISDDTFENLVTNKTGAEISGGSFTSTTDNLLNSGTISGGKYRIAIAGTGTLTGNTIEYGLYVNVGGAATSSALDSDCCNTGGWLYFPKDGTNSSFTITTAKPSGLGIKKNDASNTPLVEGTGFTYNYTTGAVAITAAFSEPMTLAPLAAVTITPSPIITAAPANETITIGEGMSGFTTGDLYNLTVDGVEPPASAYTLSAGSLNINFTKSYLDGLAVGTHPVVITLRGLHAGVYRTSITVNAVPSPSGGAGRANPSTGA